jgi:hypothetical protein
VVKTAAMRAKHSSHVIMLLTGGLAVRRGTPAASLDVASSVHISPRSSAISTNSSANIFLTTFGGRAAAGLYGLDTCSDGWSSSPPPAAFRPGVPAAAAAAAARRPRPADEPAEPSVGVNVGRSGRAPPGGTAVLKPPAGQGERMRALNVPTGLLPQCSYNYVC